VTKKGTCAYCGSDDVVLTIEHVFPESWYPDDYLPSKTLTVPACNPCNANYDKVEKKLFLPLRSSLAPDARTIPIFQRALRPVDEKAGKTERDRMHRKRRGDAVIRRMAVVAPSVEIQAPWTPMGRPVTDFETETGARVQGTATFRLGWGNLEAIATKFLRGCYFAQFGVPLRTDFEIWARTFPQDPRGLIEEWTRIPTSIVAGEFPFVSCIVASEDQQRVGGFFLLWSSFLLFASNFPQSGELMRTSSDAPA
jgi:hypothetical protein